MSRTVIGLLKLLRRIREKRKKEQKDYLKGKFERELNYQLWVTKGARFAASKRLERMSFLSILSLSLFSAYLIIMSIMQYMIDMNELGIPDSVFTFIMVTLSILILVIGQIIDKADLQLRAKKFHKCALKIGRIYNDLRIEKSIKKNESLEEATLIELNMRYQRILSKYPNHDTVDYNKFRSDKPKYEGHDISRLKAIYFKWYYVFSIYVIPVSFMTLPAIFIVWVIYSVMVI